MSEEKEKRLSLMRFWLFGTFVLLWAISLTYYFLYLAPISDLATVISAVWPVWVVAAIGAIAIYYGYKWWIGRDEGEMVPAAATPAAAPAAPESAAPAAPETPNYSQSSEGGSEG